MVERTPLSVHYVESSEYQGVREDVPKLLNEVVRHYRSVRHGAVSERLPYTHMSLVSGLPTVKR